MENTSFNEPGQAQRPDSKPKNKAKTTKNKREQLISGKVMRLDEYRPLEDIRLILGASPETKALWLKAGLPVSKLRTKELWARVCDVAELDAESIERSSTNNRNNERKSAE